MALFFYVCFNCWVGVLKRVSCSTILYYLSRELSERCIPECVHVWLHVCVENFCTFNALTTLVLKDATSVLGIVRNTAVWGSEPVSETIRPTYSQVAILFVSQHSCSRVNWQHFHQVISCLKASIEVIHDLVGHKRARDTCWLYCFIFRKNDQIVWV